MYTLLSILSLTVVENEFQVGGSLASYQTIIHPGLSIASPTPPASPPSLLCVDMLVSDPR